MIDTAKLSYLRNGESLKIDAGLCTGCGVCIDVCPHAVLQLASISPDKPRRLATIEARERCMECGACSTNCPVKAITVTSGVGCVAAIVTGMFRGTAPSCDCDGGKGSSGCC